MKRKNKGEDERFSSRRVDWVAFERVFFISPVLLLWVRLFIFFSFVCVVRKEGETDCCCSR